MLLEEEWADELYCLEFKEELTRLKGGKETGGMCQTLLSIAHLFTEPPKGDFSVVWGWDGKI